MGVLSTFCLRRKVVISPIHLETWVWSHTSKLRPFRWSEIMFAFSTILQSLEDYGGWRTEMIIKIMRSHWNLKIWSYLTSFDNHKILRDSLGYWGWGKYEHEKMLEHWNYEMDQISIFYIFLGSLQSSKCQHCNLFRTFKLILADIALHW